MFVDLHNHLLPEVDDGAQSLQETLNELAEFGALGVGELVMTPHLARPPSWDKNGLERRMRKLSAAFERVQEAIEGVSGLPTIRLGQELFAPDASHLGQLLKHPDIGLGGTRFLLVEFGFELSRDPAPVIEVAHAAGREVLIAHPERYTYPAGVDPLDWNRRWRDAGAFLQVNIGSLSGYYESWTDGAEQLGWRLIEDGLVHVIASDDHGENRPQRQHHAIVRKLEELGGAAQAHRLVRENPRRILDGLTPLEVAPLRVLAHSRADAA